MAIDVPTMHRILWNVFNEMLGLSCDPADPAACFSDQPRTVGVICIFGETKESLVLEAAPETARLIAATMFDTQPGLLEDDEIADAIGEVANMVGGNLKGTYPGESQLSMPCVSCESGQLNIRENENHTWIRVSGMPLLVRWQEFSTSEVTA